MPLSGGGNVSPATRGTEDPPELIFLSRFLFLLPCIGPLVDAVISHADRVGGSSDASYLTVGDAGRAGKSALGFGDDVDCSCGAGTGVGVEAGAGAEMGVVGAGVRTGKCTCGMEMYGTSLLWGWVVAFDPSVFFAFVNTLSRRSCMDLPKINAMAAVWCGLSPDEELRIVLGSKVASTKGFSLDWNSSCSISLIRS